MVPLTKDAKYNVETRTVSINLADPSSRAGEIEKLEGMARELDVGVLGR